MGHKVSNTYLRFGVSGSRFEVRGVGFGLWALKVGVAVWGFGGLGVWGFGISGSGFGIWSLGFRVWGLGIEV